MAKMISQSIQKPKNDNQDLIDFILKARMSEKGSKKGQKGQKG